MIDELAAIIAPLVVCAGLGFGWARFKLPYDSSVITALVMNIGVPFLVFSTLVNLTIDPVAVAEMALAAFVAILCFLVIGFVLLRLFQLSSPTYLPAIAFANVGNMGLPLCLFAFGEVGLALGMAWYIVGSLSHFTLGIWISSGQSSPAVLLKTPLIYALIIAILLIVTDTEAPRWLVNTADLLGGLSIPLMLFTLGVSLASLRVAGFGRAFGLSIVRLGLGVLVGLALAEVFALEGAARGVMILDSAMPVAVFNFLIAEKYGRAPSEVAGMIVVSTTISFLTLPLLLLLVL